MREILFRGKRVDGELWVEGSLVNNIFFSAESNRPIPYIIDPHEYESYDCMEDIGELAVEVLEETVGQFTGLVDKNGKKIFKGDVLRYGDEENHKDYAVCTYNGCFMVGEAGSRLTIAGTNLFDCIVIGNIHDNPELAKEDV